MLDVLLESKSVRTRRMGGTLTSVLLHGAIITTLVALGVRPRPIDARTPDAPKGDIIYIPIERVPEAPRAHAVSSATARPSAPVPAPMPLPTFDHVTPGIPPVDLTAPPITDQSEFGRGVSTGTEAGERRGLGGPADRSAGGTLSSTVRRGSSVRRFNRYFLRRCVNAESAGGSRSSSSSIHSAKPR